MDSGQLQLAFHDERSPRQRSQQLSLPCPLDRREPDDLTDANRETHISNSDQSPIIQHIDIRRGYNDPTERLFGTAGGDPASASIDALRAGDKSSPSIAFARSSAVTILAAACSTTRPRRSTVTSSAIASASSKLVRDENDRVPGVGELPQPAQAARRASAGARTAVGSSRMSIRASRASAFTISRRCCRADRKFAGARDWVERRGRCARRSHRLARRRRGRIDTRPRPPSATFSATVIAGDVREMLMHHADAGGDRVGGAT